MSPCQRCGSARTCKVSGKTSDMFCWKYLGRDWKDGYVPYDIGIGGGDDVAFSYCMDCGQIQGIFPVGDSEEVEG